MCHRCPHFEVAPPGCGFAVLTFDKRSCGPFNGCADNDYPTPSDDVTFATFVDDVDRMLDHLADHSDIDRIAHRTQQGRHHRRDARDRRNDLDAVVHDTAARLIGTEPDEKYRRKYTRLWKAGTTR